ncbi:MAG: peptidase C45 [Bacteroidales bacterium]|nr:peptidase C45 [Bacteroidales bacterium]
MGKYKIVKVLLIVFGVLILVMISFGLWVLVKKDSPSPPTISDTEVEALSKQLTQVDSNFAYIENSWFRKRSEGFYELYVEGAPFERGVKIGKLTQQQVTFQESVFVEKISEYIPSYNYRIVLNAFIAAFNSNLDEHIPIEYQKEIFGISFSASSEFDVYGKSYLRLLNYHGAHDIGHMMQNYMLVGCTSFSQWNKDERLLMSARNFDFYFGDAFSKNKIVAFVAPDKGYNFAFVTWGGMIGVVSGMNQEGLCVTVNAGTPEIPFKTGTPVSILAREILQYAKSIDEAVAIARKFSLFVSESFHITSAYDTAAVIIEKTPNEMDVVLPDTNALVCTNFYQSALFKNTEKNTENKENEASFYRYQRVLELLPKSDSLSAKKYAAILRNRNGKEDKPIGNGNEKAINQLLAHHGIIFSPLEKTFWISTSPNVLGEFVAYNLDSVFAHASGLCQSTVIESASRNIAPDEYFANGWSSYNEYKLLKSKILNCNAQQVNVDSLIDCMIQVNQWYYEPYQIAGDYFFQNQNCKKAQTLYKKALTLEIPSKSSKNDILNKLKECNDCSKR